MNGPSSQSTPEIHDIAVKSNNILMLSYDGSHIRAFLNGNSKIYTAFSNGLRNTSYPLSLGGESDGGSGPSINFSEIMVFKNALDNSNREIIEGYLAHKWGLSGSLPSSHTYKSNAPTVGGWSVSQASSGDDKISISMEGAGGEFSQNVPMNDDSWHHLATTFGGGNKKIYVDGEEVASASQSGNVTDSVFKLV